MLKRILKNEHYKKYFFNTGWLLGDRLFRILSNVLVGIVVARHLGPANFGLINYALSFIAFFAPIAGLGLGDIVVRELVRTHHREDGSIVGTALVMRLACSVILIPVALLAGYLMHEGDMGLLMIMVFILLFQSSDIIERYFQSHVKTKYVAQAGSIAVTLSSVLKIILVINNSPLSWFALAYLLEAASIAFCLAYFFWKRSNISFSSLSFHRDRMISFLREAWPLILSGLMVIVYMRIDQIMIMKMLGPVFVGRFTAAIKISEAFYFIPMVVVNSLYPAILHGKNSSPDEYHKRLQKLFDLLTWVALPGCLLCSLFANTISSVLYGASYIQTGQVLAIHIWCSIFVFWGVAASKWLIIEHQGRFITINSLVGSTVNIILNLVLIPRYNIIGAALASLAAQFCATFLSFVILSRTRPMAAIMVRSLNPFRALSYAIEQPE